MLQPLPSDHSFHYETRLPSGRKEHAMWLQWLIRLRWVAVAAQVVAVSFTVGLLTRPVLVAPALLLVTAALALVNHYATRHLDEDRPVDSAFLLQQLSIDVVALTILLLLAGGPTNPFKTLYVIHVAMAAMTLKGLHAGLLTALVLGCYAILPMGYLPIYLDRHTLPEETLLLLGDDLAFGITAGCVGLFMYGTRRDLRSREAQVRRMRDELGEPGTEELEAKKGTQ